ncbi:MAG: O-antigen ligase domain-containing protein, partial [Roseiarcus sp.]
MSNAALPANARPPRAAPLRLSVAGAQRGVLWLFIVSGAFASLEPSPYEIFFVLALLAFGVRGLLFDPSMIP